MDLGTLIGLIVAIVIVIVAIFIGSGIGIFINVPGILIVVVATIGVVLIRFPMQSIINSVKAAVMTAFFEQSESPRELINLAIEISKTVKKSGVLALENYPIKNKFFAKGIALMVDGHNPDFIKSVLENEMRTSIKTGEVGKSVFTAMADSAPAMGMIGTLVGLVQMLANLDDPSSIGPAMAVALLTTLYGSIMAQIFGIPIADKLESKSNQDKDMMNLIIESIFSIQTGQAPSVMAELLETFVVDEVEGGK